jgi:hypothetical protein
MASESRRKVKDTRRWLHEGVGAVSVENKQLNII